MTLAHPRFCLYLLWLTYGVAHAQWQPTRPVQLILPNAPGGGLDFIARLLAPKLSEAIKQNVVVDNRASNNGIVGAEIAARSAPDQSSEKVKREVEKFCWIILESGMQQD